METLTLFIPDWSRFESELGINTPFWQWTVADQPLIDHWIDRARDEGYNRIQIIAESGAAALAAHLENVPLIPCEWELLALADAGTRQGADVAVPVSDLPGAQPLAARPATAWDLVDHHRRLERQRLLALWDSSSSDMPSVCLGRFARVHPSATIEGPVWIGDNVRIDAEAHIGPFTVIGDNCVVSRGSTIRATFVARGTVLGAHTEFDTHFVSGNTVLNRAERLRLENVDRSIARPARRLFARAS